MEHLNNKELNAYVKKHCDENLRLKAEEHIFICDACLAGYMNALDAVTSECCEKLSSDFSDRVMNEIKKEKILRKSVKKQKLIPDILIYYTAAACITLIFMATGGFQAISADVSDATARIAASPSSIEGAARSGWTERLVEDMSVFFDGLTLKD
jgi:hypothetical protein